MSTARTCLQLNTEDEKPELSDDTLRNTTADCADTKHSSQENLKHNLENLNIFIVESLLRRLQPDILEGIGLEHHEHSSVVVQRTDDTSANDGAGHDQVDISGRVDSSLGDLSTSVIVKSEIDDDDNILMAPPQKRQRRGLKMEVNVPTMDLLRRERHLKAEEDYKKLDKMRNPKIKKNKDMTLHPDTLRARLQALGPAGLDLYPITLDKGSQDVMVSRSFMSAEYGGSMQATCPSIGKRLLEKHGMDDFMYLHPLYQPVAPEAPGANGLFLTTGSSIGCKWPALERLFTRIDSNVWQYMGMYRLTPSPSLTKQEWADLEPKVQITWGREICRQNWGWNVRAPVFARKKLGREPTKKELERLFEEGSKLHSVTPEDVMAAFTKGEETLGIWLMECVGYDNAFQLELCDKFPRWVPPKKNLRKSSAKKSKKTGPAVRAGRKRKREETLDSDIDLNPKNEDEDLEFDELPEHEDDIQEELTYRNRGTRSRPILL